MPFFNSGDSTFGGKKPPPPVARKPRFGHESEDRLLNNGVVSYCASFVMFYNFDVTLVI